ncbi:MAG: glycosyltransferase family 4 protein [Chloroflexi bacterium]|nr:glycosyltransferase family 4 protein [Chloroflexota bacterium]
MNIALLHDWLNQIGGAEDVLETFVDLYPNAPIYTSLYWKEKMPSHWQSWDIRTTFIDKLPFAHKKQQLYFPLYPYAFEQYDFRDYDVVLSNKSGFCHGVITGSETMHICYCLTPTRYVWRYHQYAEQERIGRIARTFLPPFLTILRQWDRLAADRVDHFIAISHEVRRRIAKVYHRDSTIIYPPVETSRFEPSSQVDDYYLMVGRLVPYRRIDLLIEAFNKMQRPLLIAGSGRDRQRLEALAGPTVKFLGYVPDSDLPDLLARCRAFMFPGEEDFGIAPLQAMAAGRPVIAYAAGGALETVIPGQTGIFFTKQTVEAIVQAVESFDPDTLDTRIIREHAERFDTAVFKQQLTTFIEQKMDTHQKEQRIGQHPEWAK